MDQQKTLLKSRNAIMKFLPTSSYVTFLSPRSIYSPRSKDNKRSSEKATHKSNLGVGFSGPLVSMMIPAETRRKIKNNSDYDTIVYEAWTSPKVSCMGQVKSKYQKNKQLQRVKSNIPTNKLDGETPKSKKKLGFKKIFSGVITPRRKKDYTKAAPLYLDKAPSLSTMKRFSGGRGKFSSIDWTKMMDEEEESYDDIVTMPSSAPVVIRNSLGFDDKFIRVAGINKEPKKEINLWKRRTLPQPKPLQVN